MLIPPMSSPVCMACVPASYVDLECKHLFESADVAAAGAQGCSCDSLVYVYLRREQDGVHCLSNLTKIKNNIGNVYSSHCVHIHHVYSSTSKKEKGFPTKVQRRKRKITHVVHTNNRLWSENAC